MKNFLKKLLKFTVLGGLVGGLIGGYQYLTEHFLVLVARVLTNADTLTVVLYVVASALVAFVACYITEYDRNLAGGGVIMIELAIRGKNKTINPIPSIAMMIVSSFCSFLAGVGIGAEGPSIYMSGCLGLLVNQWFKEQDPNTLGIASGAGFGCAFLSPLAGFIYIFEEALHKWDWHLVIKGLWTVCVAFAIAYLINPVKSLHFNITAGLPFRDYYVLAIVIVIDVIIGTAFIWCFAKLKDFLNKYSKNPVVKYRIFIMFGIAVIVSLLLTTYRGAAASLINNALGMEGFYVIIGLLVFKFIFTIISANSKASGGFVIPMISLGALSGILICQCCHLWFGFEPTYFAIIILVSTFSMMPIITRSPLTGMAVALSMAGLNGLQFVIIPVILVLGISFLLARLTKVEDVYEEMIKRTSL